MLKQKKNLSFINNSLLSGIDDQLFRPVDAVTRFAFRTKSHDRKPNIGQRF